MRITTLECSSSITGELRTSRYLMDDDMLIDAETGARPGVRTGLSDAS